MGFHGWFGLDANRNVVPLHGLPQERRPVVRQEHVGAWWISTVFLAIDHRYDTNGPPLVFETMVFLSDGQNVTDWLERDCRRYSTWAEAEAGHAAMVEHWRNIQPGEERRMWDAAEEA